MTLAKKLLNIRAAAVMAGKTSWAARITGAGRPAAPGVPFLADRTARAGFARRPDGGAGRSASRASRRLTDVGAAERRQARRAA